MKATSRKTFAVLVLTLVGVLPAPASSAPAHSLLSRMSGWEIELATVVAAVKQTYADIRAGRLGH